MKCKRCNAEITDLIAAETTRKMKETAESVGLSPEAVKLLVGVHAPLCRKCMQHWGENEDDFSPRR
jgi:hypothetical protein